MLPSQPWCLYVRFCCLAGVFSLAVDRGHESCVAKVLEGLQWDAKEPQYKRYRHRLECVAR